MKVVLDTNVLLVSFSRKSIYRPIFENFLNETITLCVTTDILMEYEEIIGQHFNKKIASSILQLIENAPNVEWVTKYYKWNLITQDPDDNKFVDCAIAANAKFLVSNDKHFKVLEKIPFPGIVLLKADEFLKTLNQSTED